MSLHIDGMLVDGEAIPDPSILDALANDPAIKGAVALLVTVDLAQKAGRFNITALKEFRSRDREGAIP